MRPDLQNLPPLKPALARMVLLLFCALLCLPALVLFSGLEPPNRLVEKRARKAFPDLKTLHPGRQAHNLLALGGYFNDRFGLRGPLIEANTRLRVQGFNQQILPQVVIGKEGWYYLKASLFMPDHRSPIGPMSETELSAWVDLFETRRRFYADRGIRYLVLIAPDKASIYPRHMPDLLDGFQPGQRYTQLREALAEHGSVELVDVHETLREARSQEQVYHNTDSHWNPEGAFHASRALYAAMGLTGAPRPREQYRVQPLDGEVDELTNLLGMPVSGLPAKYALAPEQGFTWTRSGEGGHSRAGRNLPLTTTQPGRGLRILVYRDSFFTALQPFVSEFAEQAVYVWKPVHDQQLADADLVIDQLVERKLAGPPPAAFTRDGE